VERCQQPHPPRGHAQPHRGGECGLAERFLARSVAFELPGVKEAARRTAEALGAPSAMITAVEGC
jgi:predicted N-formylglutamate amidohydrolase